MWRGLCFFLGLAVFNLAWARDPLKPEIEGLVEALPNRHVYVKVYEGDPSLAPIVVVNGLTQDTDHWSRTLPELLKSNATVVLYDAFLQGRSLRYYLTANRTLQQIGQRPILPPLLSYRTVWAGRAPLIPELRENEQAEILNGLLDHLNIKQKVVVAGLSYGGAVALQFGAEFPERTKSVVLAAPYVKPMEAQDQLVERLKEAYKRSYPWQPYADGELYDFILRGLILTTYHLSEPTILKWGGLQPFAVSEMVEAIRHLDAPALAQRLPPHSVHLVIAGLDAYIPRESLIAFWQSVPTQQRGSLLVVEGVEHKINESVGPFLGAWTALVASDDPRIQPQHPYLGVPEKGFVKSVDGRVRLELPKTDICENLLRPTNPKQPNPPVDRIARYPGEAFVNLMRSYLTPEQQVWLDRVIKFWRGI